MAENKDERTLVYIYQTKLEATLSDIRSLVVLVALMGIGVWLQSPAMQWFGFILGALWIIGRVTLAEKKGRMTPQQAADLIAKTFNVRASI